jgi:hypothetical protein
MFVINQSGALKLLQRWITASVFIVFCILFTGSANSEVLNWNYPASNTDIIVSSSSTVVNGVTVTTSATATAGKFTTNSVLITPGGASNGSSVGIIQMAMDANIDDETAYQTTTVRFSEPVYNVSFTVLDIDGGPTFGAGLWNDIIEFNSDNGRPSGVVNNGTWVSYNSATGRAMAISNQNAASGNANQANGNITLTFAGPVTFFSIRHYSAAVDDTATGINEPDPNNQVIFIDDVAFTRSPRLTIEKTSNGGTGTFAFSNSNGLTFTAPSTYTYGSTTTSVTTNTSGVAVTGSAMVLGVVNTATTITETNPIGWEFSGNTANCTDSNSVLSGNPASFSASISNMVVTLASTNIRPGAVITCSLVNVVKPRLTLVKTVTNNNGGSATVSSFTLVATGLDTISGSSGSGAVTNVYVRRGTYALSETGPTGYDASAWTCTAGSLSGNNLTLSAGQNATCSINNNDIGPFLTLVKTLVNDNGGTATIPDFTLTATGPVTISGTSGSPPVTNYGVNPGTYTLTESGPTGYAASGWSCSSGSLSGNNLTLVLGQNATCTISNNDIAPRLTLVKTVTDTSGGPSTVPSFILTATGPSIISGITGNAAVTNAAVNVGSYTLTESGPAGYTAGNWSCTAGTLTGNSLALNLAQTSVCTINNVKKPATEIQGRLILQAPMVCRTKLSQPVQLVSRSVVQLQL